MSYPHSISIAIVGAGVAGIAAARRLWEVGLEPQLFDRGRGVGGRCSSRRALPFAFDHGAQYFTVRDRVFGEHVREWHARGWVAPWEGRIVSLDPAGGIHPTSPTQRWVGVPSMGALPKALAGDLSIQSNTTVARMERTGIAWTLKSADGRNLGAFERVLLAMPPAQALGVLPENNPLVPRIQSVAMRPCWALMLGLEESYDVPLDGAFCADSPLAWAARNNSKPGRPQQESWVLHANPEWSAAHFGADRDSIRIALERALEERTGKALPRAVHADLQRWGLAIPANEASRGVWMDRAGGIALAGDAYMGGRIEGAFLSGRLAAEALVGAADRGAGYQRTLPDPEDA
ncbi:MAG: FAD-dependent oxidoreductase [Planctomycetes bacterium]|nr:FAD-dependent oxidoreductase [Planctomycetota bacterium]MCB9909794.1 FAD-dependent oxidoreductase [Planctomycetota bacterium]MCB9912297.1 FAD-dependent oxidoreductase [Planctomycetota bacterium]HRV80233.1 FAD-dependent oxidoreductase [Planctomycetota bacterium]